MVAFQNPIVYYLTIPSGATSGERVVIDGVNGVIDIYNSSNVLIAQIGNGAGLTLYSGEGIVFADNADPNNHANIFSSTTDIVIDGYTYTSSNTGHSVFDYFDMGINQISIGFAISGSGNSEGGNIGIFPVGIQLNPENQSPGGLLVQFDSTSYAEIALTTSGGTEGWHAAILTGGWTAGSTAGYYSGLQYYRDATGIVHVTGCVKAPAAAPNTIIATLPVGYRPSSSNIFLCVYTANTPELDDVVVTSAGTIVFSNEFGVGVSGTLFITLQFPTM
jgi:hypothetical protein